MADIFSHLLFVIFLLTNTVNTRCWYENESRELLRGDETPLAVPGHAEDVVMDVQSEIAKTVVRWLHR